MSQEIVSVDRMTIGLGEKSYEVPAAGLARSEAWRAAFQAEINGILDLLREQGRALGGIDFNNLKDLAGKDVMELLPVASMLFARLNVSMNKVAELVISYSPALEADAEYIRANATTRQAVAAFIGMVKFEFPFGSILSQIRASGAEASTNSRSLPGPSGALPHKNRKR